MSLCVCVCVCYGIKINSHRNFVFLMNGWKFTINYNLKDWKMECYRFGWDKFLVFLLSFIIEGNDLGWPSQQLVCNWIGEHIGIKVEFKMWLLYCSLFYICFMASLYTKVPPIWYKGSHLEICGPCYLWNFVIFINSISV